ncbi:MAG: hypothetical protein A2147_01070 [Chloroflexi bacterium RBG_16_57_8]|nr:MAG: hypothetical protein A2147_01070 [Chloroflexi bacterium RBG_16_57_8]
MLDFQNGVVGKCEFFPLHREAPVWPGDLRKIVGERGILVDDLWPNVWPRNPLGQITLKISNSDKQVEVPIRRIEEEIGGHRIVTRIEVDSDPPITWENPVADVFRASDLSCVSPAKPTEWVVAEVTGYRDFARSLTEGRDAEYGCENGRNDLELTLAMYESARLGRKLVLPLTEVTEHERQTHEMFLSRYGRPIL